MERLKLETIENIIKTHRTVVEVLENENIDDDYDLSLDKCIIYGMEELKQYRIAEEQGLLLRLPAPLDGVESFEIADKGMWMKIPCRKGDTVYEIDGITWKGHDWKYRSYESAFVKETVFRLEMLSEIGKTVFLTKEEAEQALERMEGEHE